MKNFSRKIDTRNMEIKKIFDNHKSIVLFGYNEIARYFLEKEISKICAVDEKLINNLNEIGDFFFLILCGPNEKKIEDDILSKLKKSNYLTLSNKKIYDLVPYLCASDMYVGNDSFGSHIISQSGKKSIVFLLDSPKAYTDYSKNYFRIIPEGYKIEEINHGTNANPNLISVNEVIENITRLKN